MLFMIPWYDTLELCYIYIGTWHKSLLNEVLSAIEHLAARNRKLMKYEKLLWNKCGIYTMHDIWNTVVLVE